MCFVFLLSRHSESKQSIAHLISHVPAILTSLARLATSVTDRELIDEVGVHHCCCLVRLDRFLEKNLILGNRRFFSKFGRKKVVLNSFFLFLPNFLIFYETVLLLLVVMMVLMFVPFAFLLFLDLFAVYACGGQFGGSGIKSGR